MTTNPEPYDDPDENWWDDGYDYNDQDRNDYAEWIDYYG